MGYLKSSIEYTLESAEKAKLNDYVAALRKSFKPADTVAAGVESVLSTHGAPLVNKIDLKLDPVVDAATEKYGMAKEKCSEAIVYAQTKKEGVVNYAVEKKEGVITKAKDIKKNASAATEDLISKVKSGEVEQQILKKAECNKYASFVAKTVIDYKGKLVLSATTLSTQLKTKGTAQYAALKAYAMQLKGKLPIAEVNAKVEALQAFVTAKSSPYVDMAKPYITKAKTEISAAKTKVYEKFMEIKKTYLAKKTA